MNESEVNALLTNDQTPLAERIALAEELFSRNPIADVPGRARAACWWLYRQIDARSSLEDFVLPTLWVVQNCAHEPIRVRWNLSIRLAWCYAKILRGDDVRGYLIDLFDWNALKVHPMAAVNICRAALLSCISERIVGRQDSCTASMLVLEATARAGFSRMSIIGGYDVSANEMESLAGVCGIAIRLMPHLGLPFNGTVPPLDQAVRFEPPGPFKDCVVTLIQRLSQTSSLL